MKNRLLPYTLALSTSLCFGLSSFAADEPAVAPKPAPAATAKSDAPPAKADAAPADEAPAFTTMDAYKGTPYEDSVYKSGIQVIPGTIQCAYFDLGGEGVAYHDLTPKNLGSGGLNPANPKDASLKYVNEFRMNEAVDTSYTKFRAGIDDNKFDLYTPPEHQMYLGWTDPGEWVNITVNVKEAGTYALDVLHTSAKGGAIGLDLDGKSLGPPINIRCTWDDKEDVQWRNWHHWNYEKHTAEVTLPKGKHVLTVRILKTGNMNLAFIVFYPKPEGSVAKPVSETDASPKS